MKMEIVQGEDEEAHSCMLIASYNMFLISSTGYFKVASK
jgi:hypothetical protein